jgi:hypothetical protein
MLALLLASLLPDAADACAPDRLRPSLEVASKAFQAKDLNAARTALEPVAACPIKDGITYVGHVLRAEVAVRQADWNTARAMLAGAGIHPENGFAGRAGFFRLRADQGLGDARAFTADRDALIAANDQRLAANGGRVERFAVPGGHVDAYRTGVDQGSFHRVYEFIATPDDPAAYPVSVQLTDDHTVDENWAVLNKTQPAQAHPWYLDLYACGGHATLKPVATTAGADRPDYASVKAAVQDALADGKLLKASPPPPADCGGALWVLPGIGGRITPSS